MSSNKYADLPDIDTAPDVYETEDVFPSSHNANLDGSDDESGYQSRPVAKGRVDGVNKEELDTSNSISPEDASKKFRKAEKKRVTRALYTYPDSPTSPSSPIEASGSSDRQLPLSHRLRTIQAELASLEHELADPSNPLIQKEREEANVDPGELIRGLVDVRGRLNKILKEKEGRARLVGTLLHEDDGADTKKRDVHEDSSPSTKKRDGIIESSKTGVQTLVDVDRRVEELERMLGSSSTSLDESSPLPPPLLPLITKLNSQLALLTQPRHIDSISRRLKLLLSDLDRASVGQHHRHQASQGNANGPQHSHEQLLNIVNRIAPSLPQIPHILSRLRTLSTLHAAAGEFQDTLRDLEQEQKKIRGALQDLQTAVNTVEHSLEENREVVKGNVAGLDARVDALLKRLDDVQSDGRS